jgi:hypothetical protein
VRSLIEDVPRANLLAVRVSVFPAGRCGENPCPIAVDGAAMNTREMQTGVDIL